MSDDKEREDLESLLQHPGWLRFKNALNQEWMGRYDTYVDAAVNGQRDALTELLKLSAARTAVMAATRYPETRIGQLDAAAKARALDSSPPLTRRGSL